MGALYTPDELLAWLRDRTADFRAEFEKLYEEGG